VGDQAGTLLLFDRLPCLLHAARELGAFPFHLGVLDPQSLRFGLRGSQTCLFGRARIDETGQLRLRLDDPGLCADQSRIGHGYLEFEQPLLEPLMTFGTSSLLCEGTHFRLDFNEDVIQPLKVGVRLFQPPRGCAAPIFVPPDRCRLLKQGSTLLSSIGQDGVHHPTLDHRVGVGPQTRVATEVEDIPQPARRSVEGILALAPPVDGPSDRHLGVRQRQRAILIGKLEDDLRPLNRAPLLRTAEDRLFHARSADRGGPLLPEHPTQGVGDVRLAAAVRAHDRGNPTVKLDLGTIGKRLEAMKREGLDPQWSLARVVGEGGRGGRSAPQARRRPPASRPSASTPDHPYRPHRTPARPHPRSTGPGACRPESRARTVRSHDPSRRSVRGTRRDRTRAWQAARPNEPLRSSLQRRPVPA